jgi:hypothetical protein
MTKITVTVTRTLNQRETRIVATATHPSLASPVIVKASVPVLPGGGVNLTAVRKAEKTAKASALRMADQELRKG